MMRRVFPALLLLSLGACATSRGAAYNQAFAAGARAKYAGRHEEAAKRYEEAARASDIERDQDNALLMSAMELVAAGNVRDATERLDGIAKRHPQGAYAGEARYEAAVLRIRFGEADRGYAELERLIADFPERECARTALPRVLKHKDRTQGMEAAIAYLDGLTQRGTANGRLGEAVRYEQAQRLRKLGQKERARDAYVDTATRWPYPKGSYFDDALYHAAEIEEELGRNTEAIALLERLVVEHETAEFMGSYQRPRMAAAQYRIGRIYEEKLKDMARAKEAYRRVFDKHTTSTLRDDALFREASLKLADNDANGACSSLGKLVSATPDSRYVPCAIAQCPQLTRAKDSKAPQQCHGYLKDSKPDLVGPTPEDEPAAPAH
jgi:tetratricopeptide (TPR) repeat protein